MAANFGVRIGSPDQSITYLAFMSETTDRLPVGDSIETMVNSLCGVSIEK